MPYNGDGTQKRDYLHYLNRDFCAVLKHEHHLCGKHHDLLHCSDEELFFKGRRLLRAFQFAHEHFQLSLSEQLVRQLFFEPFLFFRRLPKYIRVPLCPSLYFRCARFVNRLFGVVRQHKRLDFKWVE